MTTVVNNSSQTLKMGGKILSPRDMADVEVKNLENHLFVRSGLIVVSSGSSAPSAKERAEEARQSNDEARLLEMLEDSAKTVRDAAEARLAELESAGQSGEE